MTHACSNPSPPETLPILYSASHLFESPQNVKEKVDIFLVHRDFYVHIDSNARASRKMLRDLAYVDWSSRSWFEWHDASAKFSAVLVSAVRTLRTAARVFSATW